MVPASDATGQTSAGLSRCGRKSKAGGMSSGPTRERAGGSTLSGFSTARERRETRWKRSSTRSRAASSGRPFSRTVDTPLVLLLAAECCSRRLTLCAGSCGMPDAGPCSKSGGDSLRAASMARSRATEAGWRRSGVCRGAILTSNGDLNPEQARIRHRRTAQGRSTTQTLECSWLFRVSDLRVRVSAVGSRP